jgi:hypothetical protein
MPSRRRARGSSHRLDPAITCALDGEQTRQPRGNARAVARDIGWTVSDSATAASRTASNSSSTTGLAALGAAATAGATSARTLSTDIGNSRSWTATGLAGRPDTGSDWSVWARASEGGFEIAAAQVALAVEEPPVAVVELGRLHARPETRADLAYIPHQDPLQLGVSEMRPNASPAALDVVILHSGRYPAGGPMPTREYSVDEFVQLPYCGWDSRPETLPLDVEECATALYLAHGALNRAAELLKVSPARLNRVVRRSPRLQRLRVDLAG